MGQGIAVIHPSGSQPPVSKTFFFLILLFSFLAKTGENWDESNRRKHHAARERKPLTRGKKRRKAQGEGPENHGLERSEAQVEG
jgi:hypothetical protein